MSTTVQTGHTKSAKDLSLVSLKMKSNLKEDVVLLLQIYAEAKNAKTLETECTTIIKHSLLETDGDPGERLDSALKEINGLLKGFLVAKTIDDIHAIVAIVGKDDSLHVSHAGSAEGYIVRGGQASQITEYTRGKSVPAFVHIASGSIEPRDVIVFSTQRLLRTVTPAQLAKHAQRGDQLVDELIIELEADKEKSAVAVLRADGKEKEDVPSKKKSLGLLKKRTESRRRRGGSRGLDFSIIKSAASSVAGRAKELFPSLQIKERTKALSGKILVDIKHPQKRKKTHLLILAGLLVIFLIVWSAVKLTTSTQNSQSRAELEQLIAQIDTDIGTAENRYLAGDIDAANAILERAQERAKQVMDHESGRFRIEALDLLDRIRLKDEEINNIVRLSPRVTVNLAAKNPDIAAYGLIGVADGDLIIHDRQDIYRVILNSVEEPDRVSEEELIQDGDFFERMQTLLFLTTENSIIEIIADQATSMKTEDPAGWIAGKAVKTYLRFLYLLSPENNQIYKYERLSNRYAPPAEYNIDGDLSGGLDLAIDGNVFVLKKGGEIVKLFRGETRPFTFRHLPDGAIENATKIFKAPESGNFYFLDPVGARVIVTTDGGATGESDYVRQYILEGEQIGDLKDIYVDPEQLHLYVADGKRLYAIDLVAR
ncbi:hypothetical protein KJ652_01765 [Patescibacteria group bacterium]|nr:hypothetical protein [Patescibacteria group bacterium]MBU1911690.1 hypothetical protein [Patescibacteria group bacterium]